MPTFALLAFAIALTAPYWLGPFLVYAKKSMAFTRYMPLTDGDFAAVPPDAAMFVAATVGEMHALGFASDATFTSRIGDTRTYGVLLESAATGELAVAAAAYHTRTRAMRTFAQFRTGWRDGRQTITAMVPPTGVFPTVPERDGIALPTVRDVSLLYRAHQRHVANGGPRSANRPMTRGADPLAYETADASQMYERLTTMGHLRRVTDPPSYRFTMKGAVYACFRLLPPLKQLYRRDRAREAAALLAQL